MDKESYVATAIQPEIPQSVVTNSITNPSVSILDSIKQHYDNLPNVSLSRNVSQRILKIPIPGLKVSNVHFEFNHLTRKKSVRICFHIEGSTITTYLSKAMHDLAKKMGSDYVLNDVWDKDRETGVSRGFNLYKECSLATYSELDIANEMKKFINEFLPQYLSLSEE
jgi:hypothetical protein